MDRFLPAANAIATTSADMHPKKTPRGSARCSKQDEEATAAARRRAQSLRRASGREQPARHVPALHREERETPPRQSRDVVDEEEEEAESDEMSPRACGFMLFLPWSVKPVLCGFPRSPARRSRAPRADASTAAASSPPHRSVTLGNALEKEKAKDGKLRSGDLSRWSSEKSGSGREWSSPGWGTAILGTSKRYCADARKALSRLARSATDGRGGSPRVSSRERRSGRPADASPLHSTSGEIPPLTPPSESWLSHARGNGIVSNKR
uniref:Uncharacterized protein n=1 Tax=Oryza brachyantha TaxID=4533 RepID=J3M817_ORYBR